MPRSMFHPAYDEVTQRVVKMRKDAGLTQRELAAQLDRELSFVSRIEQGQRRLDLVEFVWVCKACKADPKTIGVEVLAAIEKQSGRGKKHP